MNADNEAFPVVLEMKNICQSYDNGKVEVIKDFNLTIRDRPEQGQFRVILGPSGCGKSTVLRHIAGLQTPTSGEVVLKGKPRTESDRIGMVFQKYSSLPWLTVLDNVALSLRLKGVSKTESRKKALEMIELVGLSEHIHKYAQYPTLSGGQLQRVAIARSLLANPEILLMDEPFGALDPKTRLKMQELICSLWVKMESLGIDMTVVFVTHDITEAVYLADVIYIMGHAPAKIVERIPVDFPVHRTADLKRDPRFIQLVQQIEERMMSI